jgi:hypothetical protein
MRPTAATIPENMMGKQQQNENGDSSMRAMQDHPARRDFRECARSREHATRQGRTCAKRAARTMDYRVTMRLAMTKG